MELHLNNEINKMLLLGVANRSTDGLVFLEDYRNQFNQLMKTSIVTDKRINKNITLTDTEQKILKLL